MPIPCVHVFGLDERRAAFHLLFSIALRLFLLTVLLLLFGLLVLVGAHVQWSTGGSRRIRTAHVRVGKSKQLAHHTRGQSCCYGTMVLCFTYRDGDVGIRGNTVRNEQIFRYNRKGNTLSERQQHMAALREAGLPLATTTLSDPGLTMSLGGRATFSSSSETRKKHTTRRETTIELTVARPSATNRCKRPTLLTKVDLLEDSRQFGVAAQANQLHQLGAVVRKIVSLNELTNVTACARAYAIQRLKVEMTSQVQRHAMRIK